MKFAVPGRNHGIWVFHDPITNLFLMLIYADASSQAGLGERSQAKKKWCYSFWPLHSEYITNLAWLISMSYGTSTTTLDLQILWPNEIRRQECLSPSDSLSPEMTQRVRPRPPCFPQWQGGISRHPHIKPKSPGIHRGRNRFCWRNEVVDQFHREGLMNHMCKRSRKVIRHLLAVEELKSYGSFPKLSGKVKTAIQV